MTEHIYVQHENCTSSYCMICEGGLGLCSVCGGLEGGLPSECPGEKIGIETIDRVYQGEIDFRNGEWVEGAISKHSPAAYRGANYA